jgi:integrase
MGKGNDVDFRPFTFHHLQHKFAIEYMRRGGNIYDLQKVMGHSTVKQTRGVFEIPHPEGARPTRE